MKRFAILFAALCLVGVLSSDSFAQCRGGGGGYYGGYNRGVVYRAPVYRPAVNFSYGNIRPYNVYRPYHYGYNRSLYYGGFNRGFHPGFYGRGISIRF